MAIALKDNALITALLQPTGAATSLFPAASRVYDAAVAQHRDHPDPATLFAVLETMSTPSVGPPTQGIGP